MKATWTRHFGKILVLACGLGGLSVLASCSGTLAEQIFNTNFLFESGLETGGAEQQVAPDVPRFLLVKIMNQTNYQCHVAVTIKRPLRDETFEPPVVDPGQTVGHLVENCDSGTNPVLSVFVPLLQDISDNASAVNPIPVAQAFVIVQGLPVLIPASELPGALNNHQHFECGDTIEFVVTSSFTDVNRFRISALIYDGNL